MNKLILLLSVLLFGNFKAANRYWVAPSAGNWTNTANWSTSSGGAGGASVPGSADVAIFDAFTTANCNLTNTVNVLGININGFIGTISQAANSMTIGATGFSQNSGTFTGGSADITLIDGDLNISGGIFTAPSTTLYIGGTQTAGNATIFNHSGGTFNHNNGTVVFNPKIWTCSQYSYSVDVIPSTLFYDINVNLPFQTCTNHILTTASGDVVNAANNFTHTDGIINGLFTLDNNLTIAATADGGTGTITFDGTGAQTYFQAAGSTRTCKIAVNKASGAVTPALGNVDFTTQGFNQILGDFTAPTGNFSIGGDLYGSQTVFAHQAGTFSHNNGTVTFDGKAWTCSQYSYSVDVIPTTLFYDVVVNLPFQTCTNHILTTVGSDVVNAAHNFTHTDGIINGLFTLDNNLVINATADGGTGTVTFDGTGAQTYFQAAGSTRTCKIAVNKASGAVTPALGNVDFTTQGFNQILGDFTAPTGNFSIGGDLYGSQTVFAHQAGTFSHNNGTVTFDAKAWTCSQYSYSVDVIPSTLFYDVVVNLPYQTCTNHILTTASGDVVNAAHNFTHTDGIINGLFTLDNNLTIAATADGGTGTITFDGTGAQTYFQAAGSTRTCKIAVNKASGAVTPALGNVDFTTQGFNQILGDFTAPTGNFSIGGDLYGSQTVFAHQAGTFSHNNGTVTFDAKAWTCSQYSYSVDVIPSTLFYDVVVNLPYQTCTNHILITASGDVVNAAHNFTHTDGIINGLFTLDNNLTIAATADGGTGTITFDGTGAQTYFQAAGSTRTCKIAVNKASGAVTPALGNVDFTTQGFNQILGDFTAPTGNFSIGGDLYGSQTVFAHQAGTFSHNNGTVTFDGKAWTCSQYSYSVDVIPSTLFYDVVVNLPYQTCTNHILTTASGDVVNAAHNFTHTDGIINGLFTLDNNLVINATADGGTGTITFDGTGAQTYFQAAGSTRTCKIAVNKASGAVTPALGNVDFTVQGFNQILGDFTAPTGNFSIGGDLYGSQIVFAHQAGTFSHNTGKVIFDGKAWTCSQYTYSVDIITSTQFYNIDVNLPFQTCTNHKLGVGVNDTIYVANELRFVDGMSDANFEAVGNVTVSSTFDGGTGKLIFSGSNNQTFDLTSATNLFDGSVVINKAVSKNVTLLSGCTLDAGASQSVTFNKGILISSSSNLLVIGNSGTVSNANDSSYVRGPVRKIGNQAFAFPVGKERFNGKKYYRPIRITAPSVNTDHFTAEYFPTDPDPSYTTTSKDATLNHISRCEYWILDRTNGVSNVSVTLAWRDSTSCGVTNLSELRVARWNGSTWKDHGNGAFSGTINSGTLVTSGLVTAFSPITLASSTANNPLPIELLSFKANCVSNGVELDWVTATQINNDYFTIEKSTNALDWDEVVKVKGEVHSLNNKTYNYTDNDKQPGIHYYRLKETDLNGEFKYFNTISADCSVNKNIVIGIYPNPSNNIFNLEISNQNELTEVLVYNNIGELILSKKGKCDSVNLTNFASGVYFLKINVNGTASNHKLILQR